MRIIAFIFLVNLFSNVFPIYFKHIGTKDGLSQLSVMSIYQDNLGQMWFGTVEGASMFNGYKVSSFKPSESYRKDYLLGNLILSITGDNAGNVFFISDNSLIQYNNKRQTFDQIVSSGVQSIFFCQDKTWAGIRDSIYIYNAENKTLHLVSQLNKQGTLRKLFIDSENNLWVGTTNGLYCMEKDHSFTQVIHIDEVSNIFEDSRKNLWIATRNNGVLKRDPGGQFIRYEHFPDNPNSLSDNHVRCITEDNLGNIWIGTFNGLNKYDPIQDQFTVYTAKENLRGNIEHNSVYALCKDKQGNIWVGTYYGGVNYFNPETDIFTLYQNDTRRDDCLSFPFVGDMVEDKKHNIWICTEGGGLNYLDRQTNKIKHFLTNKQKNSIAHNNLKSICYDSISNRLYIGTHQGGLSIYDIPGNRFRNLLYESDSYNNIAGNVVNQVGLYKNEYLFLLTQKGLFQMDLKTEKLTPFMVDGSRYSGHTFYMDKKNNFWLARAHYLLRVNLENESDREEFPYEKSGLGRFSILCITEDSKGRILIGTEGDGLYCLDKLEKQFINYTTQNSSIQSNYCFSMTSTSLGHLIVSGDKGLTIFDSEMHVVKIVNTDIALPISGINDGCGILSMQSGEIFVGGTDGAVSFFESDLFLPSKDYTLYFSELFVNNEPIKPNGVDEILTESLPYTSIINLKYHQNNVNFTFATNNYTETQKEKTYEYRLYGFDDKWIQTSENHLSYTNLNPGEYILSIREKQYQKEILPKTISIAIIIHPSIFATPLFYIIYIVIILGILLGFYYFKKSKLLLQTSLELERKEKIQIEEINSAKLQFFSNISHEFRTPLTLIISQIDILLKENKVSRGIQNQLSKIQNNAMYIRNLANELLDFRKMEQGYVKLKADERDMVGFLKEIYLTFSEYAKAHSISYNFIAPPNTILIWFDPVQMQKVFYNILSNAFKYTSDKATINVVIEEIPEEIIIKITDTGIGIDKEDLARIFDKFYQVNPNSKRMGSLGTGIGLPLAKGILDLHHGFIQVESAPGYGSVFIVHLIKGKDHFKEEELHFELQEIDFPKIDILSLLNESTETGSDEDQETVTDNKDANNRKFTLLIVEDNKEILQLLTSLFSPLYQILTAGNGKEGLEKAKQEKPDIIISDVMMPEMSGTEMCMLIKNDFETCHIPIILLTAFDSTERNIEGLQRGADDYMSKPFVSGILITKCNNLIRNRILLQKKFSQEKNFSILSLANNPIDQDFLNLVNAIIEKKLNDPSFHVNTLAQELGLSRSSLFAKFKGLTGMTPNDFILTYKLKRAADLLEKKTDLQITDISYKLGFGSRRYFSKCFKEQFNITPDEYRKKHSSDQ